MSRFFLVATSFLFFSTAGAQSIDITPDEPGLTVEQVETIPYLHEVYVLFNRNGKQLMGVYTELDRWYEIAYPKKVDKILKMIAGNLSVFILAKEDDGTNVVYERLSSRWANTNVHKLNGRIDSIYQAQSGRIIASGDFKADGNSFRLAFYENNKWQSFITKATPKEIVDAFSNSTVEKVFSDSRCVLLKENGSGQYRLMRLKITATSWALSDPLPGPVSDLADQHMEDDIRGEHNYYVLGKETGTGTQFLLYTKDVKQWLPVDSKQIPLKTIEKLYIRSEAYLESEGMSADGKYSSVTKFRDKPWRVPKAIEPNEEMQSAGRRLFMLDTEKHHLYLRSGFNSDKNGLPPNPVMGPIKEVADAPIDEINRTITAQVDKDKLEKYKKELAAPVRDVMDVIRMSAKDEYFQKSSAAPALRKLRQTTSEEVLKDLEAAYSEAISTISKGYFYLGRVPSEIPLQDKALAAAFVKFLKAILDRAKTVQDMYKYLKNSPGKTEVVSYKPSLAKGQQAINAAYNEFAKEVAAWSPNDSKSGLIESFKSLNESMKEVGEN